MGSTLKSRERYLQTEVTFFLLLLSSLSVLIDKLGQVVYQIIEDQMFFKVSNNIDLVNSFGLKSHFFKYYEFGFIRTKIIYYSELYFFTIFFILPTRKNICSMMANYQHVQTRLMVTSSLTLFHNMGKIEWWRSNSY